MRGLLRFLNWLAVPHFYLFLETEMLISEGTHKTPEVLDHKNRPRLVECLLFFHLKTVEGGRENKRLWKDNKCNG